jgi:hypothetical protein
LGSGLSRLTEVGLVMMPKTAYTQISLAVLAVSLLLYWHNFARWREALWVLPGLFLWFGYRGLGHYWIFWIMPLALSLARNLWFFPVEVPQAQVVAVRRLPRYALWGVCVLVVGMVVWHGVLRVNPLTIQVEGMLREFNQRISQIDLFVKNDSERDLTPRFAVRNGGEQPLFWRVERGPSILPPGESAHYTIATQPPVDSLHVSEGGQIIVSDANGYDLRASTYVDGDYTYRYPAALPNGSFNVWRVDQNAPSYWNWLTNTNNGALLERFDTDQGGYGLRFTLPTALDQQWQYATVDTEIQFPETQVNVWVKPPADANIAPVFNFVYGLELVANDKRVWVLFGDQAAMGRLDPDVYYWMTPAPRETWSRQTLDLKQIFTDLGIDVSTIEEERIARFGNQHYPMTRLDFRLMVAARSHANGSVTAEFGPVGNEQLLPDTETMVRTMIDHPETMLIWRGDQNEIAGNLHVARSYYDEALEYTPDQARIYIGLGRTEYGLGADQSALDYFARAREMIEAAPERYDLSDLADTYSGEGWVLLRQGKCFEAAITFEQARTRVVDYPIPLNEIQACSPIPEHRAETTSSG